MQPLQDQSESAARRHPATARYNTVEVGALAQMSILPEGPICAPVHLIKLMVEREITPYRWVHPDEER
jgi:hypothetical protein